MMPNHVRRRIWKILSPAAITGSRLLRWSYYHALPRQSTFLASPGSTFTASGHFGIWSVENVINHRTYCNPAGI
ncbi:hypothetical protein B0H12DRAFT_235625 [Mycena haematopus]|nr:hypothetical protein B0H12DRAFT_235625 [Mycena haematopus]